MTREYCAFDGTRLLAEGDLLSVALAAKAQQAADHQSSVLIFDKASSRNTDVLLSGDAADIETWIKQHIPDALPAAQKGRGRPKLGVVSREVTLLPRQWAWLAEQPGGASVTLRRLVDAASKDPAAEHRAAQDATYRFATAMAGDEVGFEESMRALYADDEQTFTALIQAWPEDVRAHVSALAAAVWARSDAA